MASTFTTSTLSSAMDKEDLTPLRIDGPAAAAPVSTLIADALAASAVTAFSQAGDAIAAVDVLECGTFNIATMDGKPGLVIDGHADFPVASWSDHEGVNGLTTVEVLAGCSALALVCAKKEYTPTKA